MGKTVSLVVFDLGGVVCRFVPERRLEQFASATGKTSAEIHRLLWDSGFSRRCDRGELTSEAMYAGACERLQWSAPYDDFRRLWASAFEPDRDVLALVERVRCARATGLLTDNSAVLREALGGELREVGRHFDFPLFSCELGLLKHDAGFFEAALDRLVRTPAQVLFVDDVSENVAAATRSGIAALWFTGPGALEKDLARAGVLDG